jgi:hypothetical protein
LNPEHDAQDIIMKKQPAANPRTKPQDHGRLAAGNRDLGLVLVGLGVLAIVLYGVLAQMW